MKKLILWIAGAVGWVGLASTLSGAGAFRAWVAPETLRSDEVTLLWDKAADRGGGVRAFDKLSVPGATRGRPGPTADPSETKYEVVQDGQVVGTTTKTHFTVKALTPSHHSTFAVRAAGETSAELALDTPAKEPVISVERFGARGDGATLNTKAIQAAIEACPPHGVVLIPRGVFRSGALWLKSDMTLEIAKGGVLKGSENPADYEPFYRNRFEGWELDTYASLLNAGKMDHAAGPNVRHLSIRGEGTISGGGDALGKAMIAAHGLRGRGRLICLMNCAGVELQGLTIQDPPCWTIHYIYSEDVSCHDLTIVSNVRNGDGLDPDSSKNAYIFACSFSTGDDCIAIKSGKNPEGNVVNRPTENVWISDCRFIRGHGISIGSETSGGIRGVLVQDCVAGALLNGMQIKSTPDRGAFIEDVVVRDCDLQKITVLTKLAYNNDGTPAPEQPYFRNFRFQNIDLSKANPKTPVIIIDGFSAPGHRTKDVLVKNVRLPSGAVVQVDQAEDVVFKNVATVGGGKPVYKVTRSENVVTKE